MQVVDEAAARTPGKRSLAMAAFARSLRAIPTIISDNAGACEGQRLGVQGYEMQRHTMAAPVVHLAAACMSTLHLQDRGLIWQLGNMTPLGCSAYAQISKCLRLCRGY